MNLFRFASKIVLVSALLLAQNGGKDIPIYEGDPGTGDHKGQPAFCQAKDENGFKKNCGICDRKCGAKHNDWKCKVSCRAKACKCHPECDLLGNKHVGHKPEKHGL